MSMGTDRAITGFLTGPILVSSASRPSKIKNPAREINPCRGSNIEHHDSTGIEAGLTVAAGSILFNLYLASKIIGKL